MAADLRAQLAAAQASAEAAQEEAAAAAEALERHQAKQAHNAEQLRAAVVESQQVRSHITSQLQFCSMLVRHSNTDATQKLPTGCFKTCNGRMHPATVLTRHM